MPRLKPQTPTTSPTVRNVRSAGQHHQVIEMITKRGEDAPAFQTRPCPECPWRTDAVGVFPPEAFVHSASTSYDMARHTFACHTSGRERPSTCAGFLLSSGAAHNMNVRLRIIEGHFRYENVSAAGHALFGSYREMAVANGVDPADPALRACR